MIEKQPNNLVELPGILTLKGFAVRLYQKGFVGTAGSVPTPDAWASRDEVPTSRIFG